ncbi:hypothetical protein HMPREF0083_05716 [Aneurinibacillus aneurinilyticus ATCC 12856]|jgi:hypothetical protein|uniref:Uncharacterized protein n=1 Tax=Aneurinibacillus aneurinilyticus ATCC 12856 TaxID=649747 RepID=U1WSV6_ANEAE|nr:hypothetical protein HMPREF0083_05716 [Aneurinibacillus aneurinilyticus ATCC 12856]
MQLKREKSRHNNEQNSIQVHRSICDENDVYGISKHEIEVDTDVNEDANREKLLDESFSSFLHSLREK